MSHFGNLLNIFIIHLRGDSPIHYYYMIEVERKKLPVSFQIECESEI